jgi:catalase
VIGLAVVVLAGAFAYTGGWLTPDRLTSRRMINAFQDDNGVFPGYRRNHPKGVCVAGYFESNGAMVPFSKASVFAQGARTPVIGRFALPSGSPYTPDDKVPLRSFALRFSLPNGEQWRTGMNSMPVFAVSTPQAFYEQLVATRPDPATGKPDPKRVGAFFAAHPESGPFLAWLKTAKPSASYVTETYEGLNAFFFVDGTGKKHAVRWMVTPDAKDDAGTGPQAGDGDYLAKDLEQRLAQGPQRWHLRVTLANPGDPTNDATKVWPADRQVVDAGTLVIESEQPQDNGPCRDVNYDPTILPAGIEISDDPLLPARSSAYAVSYLRRTREEAHFPGAARPTTPPEHAQ